MSMDNYLEEVARKAQVFMYEGEPMDIAIDYAFAYVIPPSCVDEFCEPSPEEVIAVRNRLRKQYDGVIPSNAWPPGGSD